MKNLNTYLNEAIEITRKDDNSDYRIVTLVKRENIDCANISEEDFCKYIIEDIKEAADTYKKEVKRDLDRIKQENLPEMTKKFTEIADKRYKRASYKKKYIDQAIENYLKNPFEHTLSFVDFDVDPGYNGIPGSCILKPDTIDEKAAANCYAEVADNKYFKRATGWAIKYVASERTLVSSFRPYVDLIADETVKQEMEADKQRLAGAIDRFYKNTNYWGD